MLMPLLFLITFMLVALDAAARPPDFPAPPRASVSVVADEMRVQGRTMAVRAFLSDDTVEDIVAFYQELWREPPAKGAPGVAYEPDAIAPWHLLTRVEDGYVMTVQVQPSNAQGAYGYLALGKLPDPGDGPAPEPPAPPAMDGSRIQSNVASVDPGKKAQTVMLVNTYSLDSNVNFYREHYAAWRKDVDQPMGHGALYALGFRRGREEVIITIQSGRDGSQVVLNSIKHDLL
ncbi:MAG: hypothetical protein WD928_02325 [Gammaproteobacteria bacterium]